MELGFNIMDIALIGLIAYIIVIIMYDRVMETLGNGSAEVSGTNEKKKYSNVGISDIYMMSFGDNIVGYKLEDYLEKKHR